MKPRYKPFIETIPEPSATGEEEFCQYSCKVCRTVLFSSSELLTHTSKVKRIKQRKDGVSIDPGPLMTPLITAHTGVYLLLPRNERLDADSYGLSDTAWKDNVPQVPMPTRGLRPLRGQMLLRAIRLSGVLDPIIES